MKIPRKHQSEALEAISRGLESYDRVSVVAACGAGKTLIEILAAEALMPRRTIVFVPTLFLMQQMYQQWNEEVSWGDHLRPLCICSDEHVGRIASGDEMQVNIEDFAFPTCTSPEVVSDFLMAVDYHGAAAVLFCTYASAPVVGDALKMLAPRDRYLDVGIFDEAHKTVGEINKLFAYALHDSSILIRKRLFFTATQRVIEAAGRNGELAFATMDDEAVYGPKVYELGFAEAARRKIIVPFKIVISVIDDSRLTSSMIETLTVKSRDKRLKAMLVANQIALERTMEEYGLSKAITFHGRISAAKEFAQSNSQVTGANLFDFERFHVSGKMPGSERKARMNEFREADRAVISNSRCLTEGVDVPAVDLVAFMDPKSSKIDIVQAAGRAMRRDGPFKEFGYILLPLHLDVQKDETVEEALGRSDFRQVADVLSAMTESEAELLDMLRSRLEQTTPGESNEPTARSAIVINVGSVTYKNVSSLKLIGAISTRLMNAVGLNWHEWIARNLAYKKEFGSLEVPQSYACPDGARLGIWQRHQRVLSKLPGYSMERRRQLEMIGFRFGKLDIFQKNFPLLVDFKTKFGHCQVPVKYRTECGFNLGRWLGSQVSSFKKGGYSAAQAKQLSSLGVSLTLNRNELEFKKTIAYLKAFRKEFGHCRVQVGYVAADGFKLGDRSSKLRAKAKLPGFDLSDRKMLSRMGFEFDAFGTKFDKGISNLKQYKKKFGDCEVPPSYVCQNGFRLGVWHRTQRTKFSLYSESRRQTLSEVGFKPHIDDRWSGLYDCLVTFKMTFGHANPSHIYVTPEGIRLGTWCGRQRRFSSLPGYPDDRRKKLQELGFVFDLKKVFFEVGIDSLKRFQEESGKTRPTVAYVDSAGFQLGRWLRRKLDQMAGPGLPKNEIKILKSLGIVKTKKPSATSKPARSTYRGIHRPISHIHHGTP